MFIYYLAFGLRNLEANAMAAPLAVISHTPNTRAEFLMETLMTIAVLG